MTILGEKDLAGGAVGIIVRRNLLGGAETEALKAAVEAVLARGKKDILLDLSPLTYLNSSGLSALVVAHMTATGAGGRLAVLVTAKRLRDALALTRLDAVFPVVETEQQATALFRKPPSGTP